MEAALTVLVAHGALGAFDTLWNHEWRARLPRTPSALPEQRLHAARGALLAVVFGGVALFEWRGLLAYVLAAVLLVEIVLTLVDFVVEDRTRRLPPEERVVHAVLGITGGAFLALLAPHLRRWSEAATALERVDHGWRTRVLGAMAVGLALFALRDLASTRRPRPAAR